MAPCPEIHQEGLFEDLFIVLPLPAFPLYPPPIYQIRQNVEKFGPAPGAKKMLAWEKEAADLASSTGRFAFACMQTMLLKFGILEICGRICLQASTRSGAAQQQEKTALV